MFVRPSNCCRAHQCLSTPGPSPTLPMATPRCWRTSWLWSWLDRTALSVRGHLDRVCMYRLNAQDLCCSATNKTRIHYHSSYDLHLAPCCCNITAAFIWPWCCTCPSWGLLLDSAQLSRNWGEGEEEGSWLIILRAFGMLQSKPH